MTALQISNNSLLSGIKAWRLWSLLGWLDIRQRYARSMLGPFWITVSMGVMVGSMGVVYGTLFGQPMKDYLPLVGMGFVIWALISGVLNDACGAYINNANYILQSDVGLWVYVLQILWRQLIIFVHNFVIILALFAVFGISRPELLPMFIPGLIVVLANLTWMAKMVALASARFRDVTQLVASGVQILFYITPLMWKPTMLSKHQWLVTFNPFAALVDVVRAPLLGQMPSMASWMIAVGLAVIGWVSVMLVAKRVSDRVAYWV
jgi:lipopolysaccharide transport system permease protein